MDDMLRTILIVFLSVGIIGTVYWGYKEHQEKNALLIHAENNYQRSFHELSYHMDSLHDQIGRSLAMNSGEKLSPQFVDIWRITSDALSNVSQLPLSLVPIVKTEEFLSQIGSFTYRTAIRNLDDDPLNEEELKTLADLYEEAANIKEDLRKMQHDVLSNNLRWMDVELALATEEEAKDSTIVDGFTGVEDRIGQFITDNKDMKYLQTVSKENRYESVKGKKNSEEDIRKFTRKLFDIKEDINLTISKSGDGADIPL